MDRVEKLLRQAKTASSDPDFNEHLHFREITGTNKNCPTGPRYNSRIRRTDTSPHLFHKEMMAVPKSRGMAGP